MSTFDQRTTHFISWLQAGNVVVSPKITVRDLRGDREGRGVVAAEDIAEDEELFKLPRSILLNAENNSLVKEHPELTEELLDMNEWEALTVVLLYEWKVKGKSSPWKQYFDVLPIADPDNYEFNQLMFWDDAEIRHLEPLLVVGRIGRDLSREMYGNLFPELVVKKWKLEGLRDVSQLDFDQAASLIMSYSFDVETPDEENDMDGYLKSMIPLADTLNADTTKHNASLTYTNEFLVMRSVKDIPKDTQVYNLYSEHPNAEILRRYGYVEAQGSAHDFGEIPLDLFQAYFAHNTSLTPECIKDVVTILQTIEEEEDEEFVLEAYDCFASFEVIPELVFMVQFFTIIAEINNVKPLNAAPLEVKERAMKRIYKKCYQLLEGRKLTSQFLTHFEKILRLRLAQYPEEASEPFASRTLQLSRRDMALVVLKSEYRSLWNCLDSEKVFRSGELKYGFIEDEKLVKNILKKDIFEEDKPAAKKQRQK